jgi:sarcosine oxidase subunit beta
MSARCDALVVGGGLVGCALAWQLARAGLDVVLIERDRLNQHASGRNAGSLHVQLEYRMVERGPEAARHAAEAMPLHLDAARRWATLGAELGESVGVVQHGGLMLAETAAQTRVLERKAALERSWGLEVSLLTGSQVRHIAPYLSESVVAAAFCPSEGRADARIAAPALARAAARFGARVHTATAMVSATRVAGRWRVGTQGASSIRQWDTEILMLAAGVWTTELGAMLDVELPTIPLALTMTATAKVDSFLPHLVQHAGTRLSVKQTDDGTILIGGGWPARLRRHADGTPDLNTAPRLLSGSVAGNIRAAINAVPRIAAVPVLRTWAGTTTVTPDQLPLAGPLPGRPGVFVATGGAAFTLGPTLAAVLTELARGKVPSLDLSAYDPARGACPR